MEVVQVNVVRLEFLQRVFECDLHIRRVRVREARRVRQTELGSEEDVLALASLGEPFTNQLFVVLVCVRGVPERAPTCVDSVEELGKKKVRINAFR